MKQAELEKLKGKKIAGGGQGRSARYGKASGEAANRREQREREREQGLVPFAVKLHADLVRELHEAARTRGLGLNELTDELIRKGLAAR